MLLRKIFKLIFSPEQRFTIWYRYKLLCFNISCIWNKQFHDFLMFPFNYNKPMPSNAFDVMKEGCAILEELNIKYCLADGTLLGVYRDNKLIPHDTDIDVAVLHPVNVKKIERAFLKRGFRIGRKVFSLNKIQQIVFYTSNEIPFDIIFYTKFKHNAYAFCERDFYFKHHSIHYENFEPFVLNGVTFYIPCDTESWLTHTYGRNWKTPASSKPNDWREGGNEYLTAVPFNGNFTELIAEIEKNENIQ